MMVGGFLALAALTIGLFAWLGTDISRLDRRIDDLRQDMHQVIGGLRAEMDGRLRAVEHGQAKLEGLLQPAPDPAPAPGSNCREFLGGCIRLQLSPPRSRDHSRANRIPRRPRRNRGWRAAGEGV